MPAFATHEIFGEEGLSGIGSEEMAGAVVNHRNVFHIGCQGPDLFFYNPFLSGGRKEVNLGSRMHETRINRFFQVYLEELLQIRDRFALETGISYFLGFLSHYALDTELHPYVYSRIGYIVDDKSSSSRTLSSHHRLEAVMDKQMLMAKRECMPSAYYPERRIQVSSLELAVVAGLMSRTLQRVYRVLVKPKHIRESFWWMRTVMKRIYGYPRKKRGDKIQLWKSYARHLPVLGNMLVSDNLKDDMDAMNQRGVLWRSPWDGEQDGLSDSSVWELYDNALEKYQELEQAIEPILSGMLRRMHLLEKKRSRSECVADALLGQIPVAVKALGSRSYHSNLEVG